MSHLLTVQPLTAGFQDQAGSDVKASSDAAQPPATELASAIRQKAAAAAAETAGLSSAAPQNPRPGAATSSPAPGGVPKDDALWQEKTRKPCGRAAPVKDPAHASTSCMTLRLAWPLRAAAVKTQPADGPPENFRPMSTAASTSPALQRSPSARSHFTPMRNHDYVRYPMNLAGPPQVLPATLCPAFRRRKPHSCHLCRSAPRRSMDGSSPTASRQSSGPLSRQGSGASAAAGPRPPPVSTPVPASSARQQQPSAPSRPPPQQQAVNPGMTCWTRGNATRMPACRAQRL